MSHELAILKFFCKERQNYANYHEFVSNTPNMEKEIRMLLKLISNYYNKYAHEGIQQGDLAPFFDMQYPNHREREVFMTLIDTMWETEISEELTVDLLEQFKEKHKAAALVNKLLPAMEGNKFNIVPHLKKDIEDFIQQMADPPEPEVELEPCMLNTRELVEQELDYIGWKTHLTELNQAIGGIKIDSVGCIAAYVDSGKTSFSTKLCAKLAEQMEEQDLILYAGNEENSKRLALRLSMAFTEMDRDELKADPDAAEELKRNNGYYNIRVINGVDTGSQLLTLMERYKPKVVFVDLASDLVVEFEKKYEGVSYLEQLFKWYRRLATKYQCAVICVVQGVGDAHNKKWLDLIDLYGARVAIQRSLDWCIGIGRLQKDEAKELIRYLYVSKNKQYYGKQAKFLARFEADRNKWRDM